MQKRFKVYLVMIARNRSDKLHWQSICHVNERLLIFSFVATADASPVWHCIIFTSNELINSEISMKLVVVKIEGRALRDERPTCWRSRIIRTLLSRTWISFEVSYFKELCYLLLVRIEFVMQVLFSEIFALMRGMRFTRYLPIELIFIILLKDISPYRQTS